MDFAAAREHAKQKGVREEDLTPEVLKAFGWHPRDPLANVTIKDPARTPEQVKEDLSLLTDEAKANGMSAAFIDRLLQFGKRALSSGVL